MNDLEANLRANRGAEIVLRATSQEHDLVSSFCPNPQPAYIELYASTRISRTDCITVHNSIYLIIDDSGGYRTTDPKVHEAAFEQSKEAELSLL